MNNTTSAPQPILMIGEKADTQRLHTFVRASGSQFSGYEITEIETVQDARIALDKADVHYSVIYLFITATDPQRFSLIKEIKMQPNFGALVVLTDERDITTQCRDLNQNFFLPIQGITTEALTDITLAGWEHHQTHLAKLHLEDKYQTAEKRFQDVADQFVDWLWEIDTNLNIIFSSSRKRPAQNADAGTKFYNCFLPEEKARVEDDFNSLMQNANPFQDRDYWSFDAYGSRICWSLSGTPITDNEGNLVGFRGIAKDVSSQKASADQLYHLTNHDMVTGVYNRARFYDEFSRVVKKSARERRDGALLVIDIDRFAYFNESFGHDVGDKLLVHVAQILRDNLRTGDFLARTAGDEFAIILPDVKMEDVEYRVQRVLESLKGRPLVTDSATLSYNVSVAVIRYPAHGKTADELLTKVGFTLHQAKDKGRNRIEFYRDNAEDKGKGQRHLEWLDFVTECLANESERVVLHYQPIVPLTQAGHKEFYEVLVRMLDSDGELVAPIQFINTAEEFGMINLIDEIVASRAILALQNWHKQSRDVHLSVNISGKTFDDDSFLSSIAEKLKNSGLPKNSLIFEITETALLRDMEQVRKFMDIMKQAGAGFALDDCGVGYSSFNYIRHMNLDFIKIDGTFVQNLHRNDDDKAFVQAIADIAKNKEISTVAEMVEHEGIIDKLKYIGIDYGQGFYFAKPAAELPESMKNYTAAPPKLTDDDSVD